MTTERDLLRAVAREPDDDAPRLAYSDRLEEQGQTDRAEFIRAQVHLAGLTDDSPRRRELAFRCRQLLDAHERRWLEPFGEPLMEWCWSRGFVEVIRLDPESLAVRGRDLFETTPLRRLILSGLGGELQALDLVPTDNRLSALELIGIDLDPGALQWLPSFRQLAALSELDLAFNRLDDSTVNFFCEKPFFQNLSVLRLAGNPFTEPGRQRLRDHFGSRVSFLPDRYPERLYAIQDDRLRTGWGRDLTQLLLVATTERIRLAVLDHAGNLLRIDRHEIPQEPGFDREEREGRREEVCDARLNELGFQSATIKVKRFEFDLDWGGMHHWGGTHDRGGIRDFPAFWCDEFDRPFSPEIEGFRRWLADWMRLDKFVWELGGDDMWLDRKTGEVTDT
jgi:uncharacterized protein (TIGR02996 family)